MKQRALPQSFWQQPNVANPHPPGIVCSALPPLPLGGDDAGEMTPVEEVSGSSLFQSASASSNIPTGAQSSLNSASRERDSNVALDGASGSTLVGALSLFLTLGFAAPTLAPAQQVTTDQLNQMRYRHIGPVGNRVTSVTGVIGDRFTYYAGAASGGARRR